MNWIKKGVIFKTDNDFDWMSSHACVPTVHILNEDTFRIFFSPRNANGQSMLGYIDVEADNPKNIIQISEKPLMPLGELGTFDDGGIMPCSIITNADEIYLYYVGWNPSGSVPYRNSVGLAVSKDNGESFQRMFKGPIVDRNRHEPFFTASPYVLKEDDIWHMWYASSTGYTLVNNKPEPLYIIKYASSKNGIDWERNNHTCIEPKTELEANARASVIKENNIYKMWFAYRGSLDFRDGADSYRIGYAESTNARDWTRKDSEAGITFSESGWDSKMQTYPNIIEHKGRKFLFYNGNGFGKTGIGYAVDKDFK
ncbi:hypothetical protein [Salegentibacter sp. Hel_I_6]|uniref:hypothetical protein n=1 Tax=Salegentibacter sp. Hel_I_6 TaxID=1250278 RepID=UPI000562DCDC|nr:hypothetical protein [Salegentibacter sp. Hel_I_6]